MGFVFFFLSFILSSVVVISSVQVAPFYLSHFYPIIVGPDVQYRHMVIFNISYVHFILPERTHTNTVSI